MLFFGHVGIGEFLTRPFSKEVPVKAVLLGTVLPDLIDKTIYYLPSLLTGRHGANLGLISGTRTVGHSFLFLILFALFSFKTRRPFLIGIALGMFSHIPLDVLADYFRDRDIVSYPEADPIYAYFFPLLGFRFPVIPYESMGQHAAKLFDKTIIATELLGLGLLVLKFRKRIVSFFAATVFLSLLGCGPGLDVEKNKFISCKNGFKTTYEIPKGSFVVPSTSNYAAQTFTVANLTEVSRVILYYKKTAFASSFDIAILAGSSPVLGGNPIVTASFTDTNGNIGDFLNAYVDVNRFVLSPGNYYIRLANLAGFKWYLNSNSFNFLGGDAYCESSGFHLVTDASCGSLAAADHAFSFEAPCN